MSSCDLPKAKFPSSPSPNRKPFLCRIVLSGISFDPQNALRDQNHFTDGETEAQRCMQSQTARRGECRYQTPDYLCAECVAVQALVFNFNSAAHL